MEIVKTSKNNKNQPAIINKAAKVLRAGGLVIYPTETLYGLGADPTNRKAVTKLLSYKARREGKPLSIAVSDIKMAEHFVALNNTAKKIYKNFLPGPVTIISKSLKKVAKGVESENGTLGIRIPDYPLVRKIIRSLGKPITATSANASYKKRPYSIDDILKNISKKQKDLIDLIIDAGTLPKREPSTVIDTTNDELNTLREGDISLENKHTLVTKNSEETITLGISLMSRFKHYLGFKSVIFCLQGEMGTGKTQLTKGIARALNIKETVTSPTFILEETYSFSHGSEKKHLHHIDTWRMTESEELSRLGFQKMIDEGSVIVIEWADRVINQIETLKDEAKLIWVSFEYGKRETERKITWGNMEKSQKSKFNKNI